MLKITPQFRHFASTLPGFGTDDTIRKNPQPITSSDEIIKSGKAPAQGIFYLANRNAWILRLRSDNQREYTNMTGITTHISQRGIYFSNAQPWGTTNPGVRVG
jgi:hypothetical protein